MGEDKQKIAKTQISFGDKMENFGQLRVPQATNANGEQCAVEGADAVWEWEDDLLYELPKRAARKCQRPDCAQTEDPSDAIGSVGILA